MTMNRRYTQTDSIRRVTFLHDPVINNDTGNYYVLAQDNKGFQFQVALDALPPGTTNQMLLQNNQWFIENKTGLWRPTTWCSNIKFQNVLPVNNYGSWVSKTTQSGNGVDAQVFKYDSVATFITDVPTYGVTIVSGSQITIANPGVYNIQFSAQLQTTSASAKDVYIWLKHSGVDEADSNTKLTLQGSSNALVASWNFFTPITTSGQYFEIAWFSTDTNMQLLALSGTSVGGLTLPGIPSIILTVNQVA